ncbi:hypothetical protein MB02_05220 [Croceicoccus estronivorus]|nr:hypothetical protein MB02_05220 [Croceicoccus estronivorus]
MTGGLPKTKAYHRFQQRCDYYETDLQLCELLVRDFVSIADSTSSVAVALGSTKAQHPRLGQLNSLRTRQIRGGHLRQTLSASFVKDIYEDFVEFFGETMTRAAQKGIDPGRFAGEVKLDFQARDILAAGSWDNLVALISQRIFRALENERKTALLISKVSTRLGLTIDTAVIDAAMPYLDARHMLVHQDGRADDQYRRNYPGIAAPRGKIRLDNAFIAATRSTIDGLARAIDAQIIAHNLVRPEHMCP